MNKWFVKIYANISKINCFYNEQLVLANPGSEVMKKLDKSKVLETIGQEWIFLTVGEAVAACNFMLHTCKPGVVTDDVAVDENIVWAIDQLKVPMVTKSWEMETETHLFFLSCGQMSLSWTPQL